MIFTYLTGILKIWLRLWHLSFCNVCPDHIRSLILNQGIRLSLSPVVLPLPANLAELPILQNPEEKQSLRLTPADQEFLTNLMNQMLTSSQNNHHLIPSMANQ